MKTKWAVLLAAALTLCGLNEAKAQVSIDCSCLATQAVLITNACQAVVPDLCQFTNCFKSSVMNGPRSKRRWPRQPGGLNGICLTEPMLNSSGF